MVELVLQSIPDVRSHSLSLLSCCLPSFVCGLLSVNGSASVIDSTVDNFGLPIVCRHFEYRIDKFTSLDLGINGEERY